MSMFLGEKRAAVERGIFPHPTGGIFSLGTCKPDTEGAQGLESSLLLRTPQSLRVAQHNSSKELNLRTVPDGLFGVDTAYSRRMGQP